MSDRPGHPVLRYRSNKSSTSRAKKWVAGIPLDWMPDFWQTPARWGDTAGKGHQHSCVPPGHREGTIDDKKIGYRRHLSTGQVLASQGKP